MIINNHDSESSRDCAHLKDADEVRIRELISKAGQLLQAYTPGTAALDLPESTPKRELSGQGRKRK